MKNKQPPFQITNKIIDDVAEISELTGRLSARDHLFSNPNLRRTNRIRTMHTKHDVLAVLFLPTIKVVLGSTSNSASISNL